jgi:RNA polymerase sigma-70 factor (ECF subfamily)
VRNRGHFLHNGQLFPEAACNDCVLGHNPFRLKGLADPTSPPPSEPAFLERLRQRDSAALAEAVRDHARALFAGATALGFSKDQAEDLVQDVFVVFLERIDSFEGRSQLRTWLFGILHRKAKERCRLTSLDDQTDPIEAGLESRFDENGRWSRPPADLERLLLSKEIGTMIGACMEELPFSQRQVFHLREIEGYNTTDICKILELSITHFGVLLYRARARLRECLESKGLARQ